MNDSATSLALSLVVSLGISLGVSLTAYRYRYGILRQCGVWYTTLKTIYGPSPQFIPPSVHLDPLSSRTTHTTKTTSSPTSPTSPSPPPAIRLFPCIKRIEMVYYDSDEIVDSMTYTTEHISTLSTLSAHPAHPATELTPTQEATLQHGLSKWCWAPGSTSHATSSKIDFTTYHIPSTYDLYYMLRAAFLQYERQHASWWTRWFGSRSPMVYTSFPDEIHVLLDTSLMMLTGAKCVYTPSSSKGIVLSSAPIGNQT